MTVQCVKVNWLNKCVSVLIEIEYLECSIFMHGFFVIHCVYKYEYIFVWIYQLLYNEYSTIYFLVHLSKLKLIWG